MLDNWKYAYGLYMHQPPPPDDPPPPFVSDTLFPLAGGPFVIRYGGRKKDPRGRPFAGLMTPPDTVTVFKDSPHPERTLIHEAGHVWDARSRAPGVTGGLFADMERFNPQNPQDAYYKTNDNEYVAEAFRRALDLMRAHAGAPNAVQLAEAEGTFPGISRVVEWMKTQPPFAGLPATEKQAVPPNTR